jgi:hypothetical protein
VKPHHAAIARRPGLTFNYPHLDTEAEFVCFTTATTPTKTNFIHASHTSSSTPQAR